MSAWDKFPFSEAAIIGARKRLLDNSIYFHASDLTIDSSVISLHSELGSGTFSAVYESIIDGNPVAIKIESVTASTERQTNLLVELSILQSLPHPRLVKFRGAGSYSNQHVYAKVRVWSQAYS